MLAALLTVLLVLRWVVFFTSEGEPGSSEMAESTFWRLLSWTSAAMMS